MSLEKVRPDFSFKAIEVAEFSLFQQPHELIGPKFTFKLNITSQTAESQKLILVFVSVIIFDEKEVAKYAFFKVACVYNIENFDELPREGNLFSLEKIDFSILNAISISTTRGVIWATLKGTYLHNAVMPVFNPADLKLTAAAEE